MRSIGLGDDIVFNSDWYCDIYSFWIRKGEHGTVLDKFETDNDTSNLCIRLNSNKERILIPENTHVITAR